MDINHGYSTELQNYLQSLNRCPRLTHEEIIDLTKQYKRGDKNAGNKIIEATLRYAAKVSSKYFYCGYDCLEIIQEGNMGLITALNRFDPERGVPFVSYAAWWIRASIKSFIEKSGKVSTGSLRHTKELFPLDELFGEDANHTNRWIDYLTDDIDPEIFYNIKELSHSISSIISLCFSFLNRREVYILERRYFSDPTLKLVEIATQLGVSKERVRQIQMNSINKLRNILKDQVGILLESNVIHPLNLQQTLQIRYKQRRENRN